MRSISGFRAIIERGRNAGRWWWTVNPGNRAAHCRADWFAAESGLQVRAGLNDQVGAEAMTGYPSVPSMDEAAMA